MNMNIDKEGEIINGKKTFKEIANCLRIRGACYIGWTDQDYTHLDILFTFGNVGCYGTHQRGIYGHNDLFVSIMSHNAYGFRIDSEKSVGYIIEKIGLGDNVCSERLTDLINGVCKELNK